MSNNLKTRIFEELTSKEFADYCKKNIYPALDEIKAKGRPVSEFEKKMPNSGKDSCSSI